MRKTPIANKSLNKFEFDDDGDIKAKCDSNKGRREFWYCQIISFLFITHTNTSMRTYTNVNINGMVNIHKAGDSIEFSISS